MDEMTTNQPLAARLRPTSIDEFVGQEHLLGDNAPLGSLLRSGRLSSLILWGPPGVGKTTLAQLLASCADALFISISAVSAGIREIRDAVQRATNARERGQRTLLFIDEVHRFNKAQQDALLPYVEEGLLTLIGATTENPSFELNKALLSRVQVLRLQRLEQEALHRLLERALTAAASGPDLPERYRDALVAVADGDARRLFNVLEQLQSHPGELNDQVMTELLQASPQRFDKRGDDFHDQISALHKSVRGSAPDAALYWFSRMLEGGCDPLYIGRRMVRMASEDIGNARPDALGLALDACETYERLGSPEGELALAQALVFLAAVPKSNAVYKAFQAAREDAREQGSLEVPMHLRNAPTALMQQHDYGRGYRYAHNEPEQYAAGENYMPLGLERRRYYEPTEAGLEGRIRERLQRLRDMDGLSQ